MTDKFLSKWGESRNKLNKLIFICETVEQAEIVYDNATNRTDMKNVNICSKKPYYSSSKYHVQEKTIAEYPSWYQKNY
jgi:hypothetical protein